MAKTGRPPKDAKGRKGAPISFRLNPDLRARLEAECKEDERTLSQEIELRLRESFDLGRTQMQLLGGSDHYWLMRIIAEQIMVIEHQTGCQFRQDRYTFDQVKGCVETLFDHFRPEGPSSPPAHLMQPLWTDEMRKNLGMRSALLLLAALEAAIKIDQPSTLPNFVDIAAAGRRLAPGMTKSAASRLKAEWPREQRRLKRSLKVLHKEHGK